MPHSKIVIIPTYNEIENISQVVKQVMQLPYDFHILVVDDNSPDQTAKRVAELQNEFPERLFLKIRPKKEGLGRAYIDGFQWALERGYDFVFEMDADLSHNPNDLCRLYEECADNQSDIAIGSRYIKGVNVVNWPKRRILLSYGASFYVRLITGMPVKDPTAGFLCYKADVLRTIDFSKIRFVGYAFQVEMKYKAFVRKFKLTEVPIVFTDRIKGKSKMNASIIKEAVWGVLMMRFRQLIGRE